VESWDWVSAPVICGTASGGFTCAFARPIVRLFTSWNGTTPTLIAGAPSWLAVVRELTALPSSGIPHRDVLLGADLIISGIRFHVSVAKALVRECKRLEIELFKLGRRIEARHAE
jgi:hypothetical protein